jgi:LysR family transcriptional activator of glutamate synthase operon
MQLLQVAAGFHMFFRFCDAACLHKIRGVALMDIEKMNSVLAVARNQSFSEAAAEISLSQSSVTKHVLSIEKELGITIFRRSNTSKSVHLTNDGMTFLKYAQDIVDLYQKMSDDLKNRLSSPKVSMTINMIPMPGTFNHASILSSFYYSNPEVHLKTIQKSASDVMDALLNKEADAAIFRPLFDRGVALPPDSWLYDARINIFEICSNPPLIALSESHRLANREALTLGDLREESFLVQRPVSSAENQRGSVRYNLFVQSCVNEGFEPKVLPNIDQHNHLQGETILNLVAKGVGIMLINAKMPPHIAGAKLIPLLGLTWEAKTAVAAVKGHRPKLVEKLVACLEQMSNHP